MTSYVPPIKNGAGGWIGYVSLAPRTATGAWQSNPTLATGDVKISIDGGSLANLGTLPAVTPASSKLVKITLSQAETNGDNLTIIFSDAAGAEWCDLTINLQTVARQIDDLAFPTVSGRGLDVSVGGEAGIDWANIGSPTTAVNLSATNIDVDQVVASVSGAVGSVTGSVGSVAADGITAASIAADAITAAKVAADVTTEIQSGLATAASIAALNNLGQADIRTAIGLASANLDTQLGAIAGYIDTEVAAILAAVDTEVAAIKAKTDLIPGTQDGLTFAELTLLMGSAILGKASGAATATVVFRALDDSKDRVTATVDADGNRSAVTLDAA